MTGPAESPFREDDLPARIESLTLQREALLGQLAQVEGAIGSLRPWSWQRFALGLALLPVSFALVVLAIVR